MKDNHNLNASIQELIRRITSIDLDFYSDNQCTIQVESAIDGIMHFTEVELSDEIDPHWGHQIATGAMTEWTGTFQDFLIIAINEEVTQFSVSGLNPTEFIQILNSKDYRKFTISLFAQAGHEYGIEVGDGTGTALSFLRFGMFNGVVVPWDEVME